MSLVTLSQTEDPQSQSRTPSEYLSDSAFTASLGDASPTEYVIERIVDVRVQGNCYSFLVHWSGYPVEEATWESYETLQHCRALDEFEQRTGQRYDETLLQETNVQSLSQSLSQPDSQRHSYLVSDSQPLSSYYSDSEASSQSLVFESSLDYKTVFL